LSVPPQPIDDVVDQTATSEDLGEEPVQEQHADPEVHVEMNDVETGQNLAIGASEVEPGSHDLPTEDLPAGSAQ
jgi:hypothetical protein